MGDWKRFPCVSLDTGMGSLKTHCTDLYNNGQAWVKPCSQHSSAQSCPWKQLCWLQGGVQSVDLIYKAALLL